MCTFFIFNFTLSDKPGGFYVKYLKGVQMSQVNLFSTMDS